MALFGLGLFEFIPARPPRALLFRWAVFVCGSPLSLFSLLQFTVAAGLSVLANCDCAYPWESHHTGQVVPKWRAQMACWFSIAAPLSSPGALRFSSRYTNKFVRRLQVADMSLPVWQEVPYLSVSISLSQLGAWPTNLDPMTKIGFGPAPSWGCVLIAGVSLIMDSIISESIKVHLEH